MNTRLGVLTREDDVAHLDVLKLASRSVVNRLLEVCQADIVHVDSHTRRRRAACLAVETDADVLAGILCQAEAYVHTVGRNVTQLLSCRVSVLPLAQDILALPGLAAIVRDDDHEVVVVHHIVLRHGIAGHEVSRVTSRHSQIH